MCLISAFHGIINIRLKVNLPVAVMLYIVTAYFELSLMFVF